MTDRTNHTPAGLLATLAASGWGSLPWTAGHPGMGLLMVALGDGCYLTAHDVDGVPMVSADAPESLGYTWAESPADALRLLAEHEARRVECEAALAAAFGPLATHGGGA
jgi:hypothetical protein